MTYEDRDGDTILETVSEIREFARITDCDACREEARFMIATFSGMKPLVIVFSTTCTHNKPPELQLRITEACRQGLHRLCDGQGIENETSQPVECECSCHRNRP
jgi:hypothetical protein